MFLFNIQKYDEKKEIWCFYLIYKTYSSFIMLFAHVYFHPLSFSFSLKQILLLILIVQTFWNQIENYVIFFLLFRMSLFCLFIEV